MSKLILIRHSQSRQDPARPASEWDLTEEGLRRCGPLAARLAGYRPDVVVSSRERKALATGQAVAARLALPLDAADDLHEHERRTAPYTSAELFEQTVARFFAQPDELVFGEETARQAAERFERAVLAVLGRHPAKNVAIVSHGTVMALFVSRRAGVAPLPLWRGLGMPAVIVMTLPQLELVEVVERI